MKALIVTIIILWNFGLYANMPVKIKSLSDINDISRLLPLGTNTFFGTTFDRHFKQENIPCRSGTFSFFSNCYLNKVNNIKKGISINKSGEEILESLNSDINSSINYREDIYYGAKNLWKTPKELFNDKEGDCEDYALAKYFALLDSGYKTAEEMYIAYVMERNSRISHAVLLVEAEDRNGKQQIYSLDNIRNSFLTLSSLEFYDKYILIYLFKKRSYLLIDSFKLKAIISESKETEQQ